MKISIFVLNVVSMILILNFLVANPSITGLVVAEPGTTINASGQIGFSVFFVMVVIAMDFYLYFKSRRNE